MKPRKLTIPQILLATSILECEEFFQESDKIRSADPEEACNIDFLCCKWLYSYCDEMGKEGQMAKKLIAVVKELLEIQ